MCAHCIPPAPRSSAAMFIAPTTTGPLSSREKARGGKSSVQVAFGICPIPDAGREFRAGYEKFTSHFYNSCPYSTLAIFAAGRLNADAATIYQRLAAFDTIPESGARRTPGHWRRENARAA